MGISKWHAQAVEQFVLDKAEKQMHKAVNVIERKAKRLVPVGDTGLLKSSITNSVERKRNTIIGKVGTGVSYARFVEFGTGIFAENGKGRKTPWVVPLGNGKFFTTKGMKPQPYLRPALHQSLKQIKKLFGAK